MEVSAQASRSEAPLLSKTSGGTGHERDRTLHRATSADGTEIGYWTSDDGRPLVLVHGGSVTTPAGTVHALDRRGRGSSDDSPDSAIERELQDIAADSQPTRGGRR